MAAVSFEMTDPVATQAAREYWRAQGRRLFTLGTIATTAGCAFLFVAALQRHQSVWWLVLTGVSPAIMGIVALGWLAGFWWFPLAARRRLAHLAHRQVTVDFAPGGVAFQTASERLEVAWSELSAIDPLPSFWLLRLKGGAHIPLPRTLLPVELVADLRAASAATNEQ